MSVLSSTVTTGQRTLDALVAVTEEINCYFNLILVKFNLNSHMVLVAALLRHTALQDSRL